MAEKDWLDQFLDRTLAEYSDAVPGEGLQSRILANLAAPREQRHWRWLWISAPVLAAMLLVAFFALRPAQKTPVRTADDKRVLVSPTPSPMPSPQPSTPNRPAVARIRPRPTMLAAASTKTKTTPEPRLATFPSSDEGEQQARFLLGFVAGHPEKAKEVVREEQEFQQMAEARMNEDSENRSERQR